MSRAIADQGRAIRLPVHIVEKISQLANVERHLTQTLGRKPDERDLAAAAGMPEHKVLDILRARQETLSLDVPLNMGDEVGSTLAELVESDAPSPYDVATATLFRRQAEETMNILSQREKQVLVLRYGFHSGREQTLEEISAQLGVSRERVRQIEKKALRRLRCSHQGRYLFRFMS